ncbi:sensor histidine kinase [Paenibacillus sp.]|uniref:sensor histidine kinase n=1 Tax=Paenibacillus sp. TaxID=58172 RepID=UPI002D69A491|nr:sensor histidine kinase [Paenibacillus sp.]HZG57820.1 sensor histidine kinase [Paenibacillus sp.]
MHWLPFHRVATSGFNIFQRLVAAFFIAIIPILIVSTLINRSGETAITEEITNSLRSNAHFYLSSFELEMERVIRMKQQYILDSEVQRLMMFHMFYSDSEYVEALQNIERRLQQLHDSSLFVQELKLHIPEIGMTIHNSRIDREMPQAELDALETLYRSGKHIYPLDAETLILGERYPKSNLGDLPATLWLEVVLSRKNMEDSLREIVRYNDGEAMIVSRQGTWALGSLPQSAMAPLRPISEWLDLSGGEEAESGIGRFVVDDVPYIFAYETSALLDASLIVYVPENSFLGPTRWYEQLYWILAGTSIVVVVAFSLWIYRLVHQPMYRLTAAFRRLEKGDFNIALEYGRKDEFHYLYQQFNKMSARLQQLIKDVYEQELRFNRAELKQLQAQINPHFLYNIFFLLNRIIQLEDVDNAKKLTKYLGQYFRFITRNKDDENAAADELAHVEAYIGIQKLRFGSKLDARVEPMPAEAADVRLPRLVLQPIVENAFEYGLEDHLDTGTLRVGAAVEDGTLVLVVEDNGRSLTADKLEALAAMLREPKKNIETTGIVNVHRRLQLKFGPAYGLTVGRSELGGLRVTLRAPMDDAAGERQQEETGGEAHVSVIDRG